MIYTKNHDDWFVIKHISSGQYLTFQSFGNLNLKSLTTDVELDINSDRNTHDTVHTGMTFDNFLETATQSEVIFEASLGVDHDLSNAQNATLIFEQPQDQTSDTEIPTSEQNLFSCTMCTKVFKANRYLTKHMKNKHGGKKPKQSKISSKHGDFDQEIETENSVANENQMPNDKCKKKRILRLVTEEYQGLNYTLQNNVYLHDDGHSYQKYKLNKAETTVFLRCQFGKFKNRVPCNSTAKLDRILDKIFNGQGHSHDSNDIDIQAFRFKNRVRNECRKKTLVKVQIKYIMNSEKKFQ